MSIKEKNSDNKKGRRGYRPKILGTILKKLTCLVLFFLYTSLLASSSNSGAFIIQGISGNVLTNVEKRLDELQQLKPLDQLTEDELRLQIIGALQPYAYFKAQVAVQIINGKKAVITIDPGPLTYISRLQMKLIGEGSQHPLLQKTIKDAPLNIGDPLLTPKYNKTKLNITNAAESLGYLRGTFKKAEIVVSENNTAEITLIYDTGSLFYFGQVQFNPSTINPNLLHRFVPFKPEQAYSTDKVLQLNNDLSNSGYFSSVLVKPQIEKSQTVPINVRLEPVPKYSYSLGGGYGTDTGIRGRAGLFVVPVNEKGHKFNAVAQGSFTQNALQGQYIIPGKNPVVDQYNITGNFSNLNYNTGYSNAYLLSFGQQHSLSYFKRSLSMNALYESFNYNLQPNSYQFMLYPKAKFTFTKTSNLLFSPSGYNIAFTALGGSKLTFSKTSFAQASIDAKAAYMMEPIRIRFYAHAIQGLTAINNINHLPLSLALLLGGTDNLKAFSFNSLGPGKRISYTGFELQKETVKNWYLIAFYDAGDVYNPSTKATRYDLGAAVMWVSPVGPIKLGLAQEVDHSLQRRGTNPHLVISMGPDL